ncbi:Protein Iojap/ribosomal silencing factor RsfS protein [Dioscorea alata]|uniref:Protein Iojap/ribosomal silencing factor RsfS protein n=1 Tax=Dioscorea alata TaxID=55571 RepID=A0ACB7W9W6_DIOAL|nr:Protein Iojap/ribosomal silencing factor RsfS protein [Dioscorea alata]
MMAALRSSFSSIRMQPWTHLGLIHSAFSSSSSSSFGQKGFLDLEEVEKILSDVKADDVRVIPVGDQCEWTDYMVVATGRSAWHVRNIAQALIYKVKQKQKGQERMLLPSVEGHQGGNWIVVDSGRVIVHALEEKARSYYNLESLWTTEASTRVPNQDLEEAIVKHRRKNNSKKRVAS